MTSLTGAALGLVIGCAGILIGTAVVAPAPVAGQGAHGGRVGRRVDRLGRDAGLTRLSIASLLAACAATALVAGVVALAASAVPVVGLLAAAAGAAVPAMVLARRASLRRQARQRAWPDAVDALASGVRAGMSLPEAVAALATRGPEPMRAAFTVFAAEYRATGSFAGALDILQTTLGDPVADRVIAALRLARDVGGTELGTLLRMLSAMLRDAARTRSEIEARQSWTVTAARVAVVAPWATLVLLSTRPEAAAAYRSTTGAVVLCCVAVLTVTAYALMRRIARMPIDERIGR